MLDILTHREQLMEDIDFIVDDAFMEMFGWEDFDKWRDHCDKLTRNLRYAVRVNFPVAK